MLRFIEKFIPKKVYRFFQPYYHHLLARGGQLVYRDPASKLIVIGVTGTKGKTSACNFIWSALSAHGYKVGMLTTANIRVGEYETLNRAHMTMPGRMYTHRMLQRFVKEGCTHAIVEVTSEGIKQSRHLGIAFDVAVFTNLSPEHLPSHENSFEKYRDTKARLFALVSKTKRKRVMVPQPNAIVVNSDDHHGPFYASYQAKDVITYGKGDGAVFQMKDLEVGVDGSVFEVLEDRVSVSLPGEVNALNALTGIAVACTCGVPLKAAIEGVSKLHHIPGRMEKVVSDHNLSVFVDYAHEGVSMQRLADYAKKYKESHPESRFIVTVGAEGGGRDKRKRKEMGEVVGRGADIVVLTSTDPYDEDPQMILEDIAQHVRREGKVDGKDLFLIVDRREGIRKALSIACHNDLVVITGNGSQEFMHIGGKRVPFNDKKVVQEELRALSGKR